MNLLNSENKIMGFFRNVFFHYDHRIYWRKRTKVVSKESKVPKIIRYYWLYQLKKSDSFYNASMGTAIGGGAEFDSPPILYHGLNGIVVSHFAHIGKNCTINQQVTIAGGKEAESVYIGDNVFIGAGAKIIGPVKIGSNVKIGANAVVVKNVPDNCTVVGVPARIVKISKKESNI